jgi:hypothetical protein
MPETTTPTCAKHPKVTTYLRCAACNTPICEKCSVQTAVGFKCRDCGTHHAGAFSPPSAGRAIALVAANVAAGALGAALLGGIGLWGIILALAYGRLLGSLALRISGRKIGLLVDILTAGGIVAGGLLVAWPILVIGFRMLGTDEAPFILTSTLVPLAAIAATAGAAVSRMRWPFDGWF